MPSFVFKAVFRYWIYGVLLPRSAAVFPGGGAKIMKGRFSNDDQHGHGQEKRRPSTYVEVNKKPNHPQGLPNYLLLFVFLKISTGGVD